MMKRMILVFVAVLGLLIPIYSNAQYHPINVVSSSSSEDASSNYDSGRALPNINLTVGLDDQWTFRFFSNGQFKAYEWYGESGKFSKRGPRRKEGIRRGTYSIMRNGNGPRVVYLYYDNGSEAKRELRYKHDGHAELWEYTGKGSVIIHEEMLDF